MAAGNIIRGQCVPADAAQAHLLSYMSPGSSQVGTDSFTWWFYSTGASSIGKVTYKNNVFFQFENLIYIPYGPSCDTSAAFIDGHLLGWGVVAAMVVAWSIHVLRRAI